LQDLNDEVVTTKLAQGGYDQREGGDV